MRAELVANLVDEIALLLHEIAQLPDSAEKRSVQVQATLVQEIVGTYADEKIRQIFARRGRGK